MTRGPISCAACVSRHSRTTVGTCVSCRCRIAPRSPKAHSLVFRISERMNVWISSRQAMRPLERPIDIERAVYRWHRIIGVAILAGALFTLYVAALRFQGPELGVVFAKFVRI